MEITRNEDGEERDELEVRDVVMKFRIRKGDGKEYSVRHTICRFGMPCSGYLLSRRGERNGESLEWNEPVMDSRLRTALIEAEERYTREDLNLAF